MRGGGTGRGEEEERWVRAARPAFLYVMYALLLTALPVGALAAINPAAAAAVAEGVRRYLAAIPEPLYTLFGTGYLGYTAALEWGKTRQQRRQSSAGSTSVPASEDTPAISSK